MDATFCCDGASEWIFLHYCDINVASYRNIRDMLASALLLEKGKHFKLDFSSFLSMDTSQPAATYLANCKNFSLN